MKTWLNSLIVLAILLGTASTVEAGGKDIVKVGGDVVVKEHQRIKDAVAIGGDVTVDGTVDGDAVAVGGSVMLGSNALVRGNAVTVGGTIEKEMGAEIRGDIVEVDFVDFPWGVTSSLKDVWLGLFWPLRIISLFAFVALTLLIVAIAPVHIDRFSTGVEKDVLRAFLWGLAGTVMIIPVAILLGVSVVGILLLPVQFVLVVLAFLVGYIAVARLVGKKLTEALNRPNQPILLEASLGVILLWAVGLIPLLGWLLKLVAGLLGLGTVIATFVSARKGKKQTE